MTAVACDGKRRLHDHLIQQTHLSAWSPRLPGADKRPPGAALCMSSSGGALSAVAEGATGGRLPVRPSACVCSQARLG